MTHEDLLSIIIGVSDLAKTVLQLNERIVILERANLMLQNELAKIKDEQTANLFDEQAEIK